jgi:hypothetical protein
MSIVMMVKEKKNKKNDRPQNRYDGTMPEKRGRKKEIVLVVVRFRDL